MNFCSVEQTILTEGNSVLCMPRMSLNNLLKTKGAFEHNT